MRERRQHPRVALSVKVDFDSGHNFFSGQTRDLSAGGLFIATDAAVPVGGELTVRLALEGKHYTLTTEVMWAMADAEGKPMGVGCRFVRLTAAQQKGINAFLQKRIPMDFDLAAEPDEADSAEAAADAEFERPGVRPPPIPGKPRT